MAADFCKTIVLKGTVKDMCAMLETVQKVARENRRNSRDNDGIPYIEAQLSDGRTLREMSKEEILDFCRHKRSVSLEVMGPYDSFDKPEETGLFEIIANAAPHASFTGTVNGFVGSSNLYAVAELKNGKLTVKSFAIADDIPDPYTVEMMERLPFEKFAELFHVDTEAFREEDYPWFVSEIMGQQSFPGKMKLVTFKNYVDVTNLSAPAYKAASEEVLKHGIINYEEYSKGLSEADKWTAIYEYDPVSGVKKFIKNDFASSYTQAG